MDNLANEIEAYLLASGGWVTSRDLCAKFRITDRRTRAAKRRPGLLDGFAVSSTREGQSGFIHHNFLPTQDYLPLKHCILRHAIAEIRKARRWDAARRRALTGKRPAQIERHTGQLVFL